MSEKIEKIISDSKKEYVSKNTVCQMFGLTGRRIEQLVADGVIENVHVKSNCVRYDLVDTVQRYTKYLSDKAKGRENLEAEAKLKEQKLRAEVALKESQGELHKLRTEIAAGNYISVEEVKADYSRFFIVFKNFALSIPQKMTGRLAGYVDPVEVREIENDLQKEIQKLLENFVSRATVEKKQEDVTKPKRMGRPKKDAKKK